MNLRRLVVLPLLVAAASVVEAQQIKQLTRVAPTTGLADSTLLICTDSTKNVTRACKFSDIQKRLAFKTFDSLVTAGLRMTGSLTGVGNITGGASSMTIQAGTGNSRTLTLSGTTSGGVAAPSAIFSASAVASTWTGGPGNLTINTGTGTSSAMTFQVSNPSALFSAFSLNGSDSTFTSNGHLLGIDGAVASPTYTFTNSQNTGFYLLPNGSTDTLAIATNGAQSCRMIGGATPTLLGGAGSMTIQAGTGNSRAMTLKTTTSAGTVKSTLVLGADSSVSALGALSGQGTVTAATGGNNATILQSTGGLGGISGRCAPCAFNFGNLNWGADSVLAFTGSANVVQLQFGTGKIRMGDSLLVASSTGTPSGNALISGGAGSMTLRAGTGNSRRLDLQTTTSAGTATTAARFNELQQSLFAAGVVANPSISFAADSTKGIFSVGSNQFGFTTAGTQFMQLTGTSGALLLGGGNGNMTILAGTGNSRTISLQATNGSGTAQTALTIQSAGVAVNNIAGMTLAIPDGTLAVPGMTFVSDGDTGLHRGDGDNANDSLTVVVNSVVGPSFKQDTVRFPGKQVMSNLTAASGTPNSVCIIAASKQLVENAATSCVVSSIRFKTDVSTLSPEWASSKLMQLRPSSFTYKDGGRHALGLIAENADSVDSRLGFRNADGAVNSYDQPGVLALLIATVQRQQLQIDSLRAEMRRRKR